MTATCVRLHFSHNNDKFWTLQNIKYIYIKSYKEYTDIRRHNRRTDNKQKLEDVDIWKI